MKRKISIFLLLILIMIPGFIRAKGFREAKELSAEKRMEDFNSLFKTLKQNYPFFKIQERQTGYNWLEHKSEFESMISSAQSPGEFFLAVEKIVEKLNNGHSELLGPFAYQNFNELYTETITDEKFEEKLKPWAKAINNQQTQKLYSAWLDKIKSSQTNKHKTRSVKENSRELKFEIMQENTIAYVKLPSFSQDRVKKDKKELFKFYKKIKDYPFLIIDIRGNSGGSDFYWIENIVEPLTNETIKFKRYSTYKGGKYSMPFIKARVDQLFSISKLPKKSSYPPEVKRSFKYFSQEIIKIEPKNSVNYNGKIYVLTDEDNFSAAESFAMFCKSTNWATLVGEKTGGDGVGFDPIFYALPNSGLLIRFPIAMGLNSDGSANYEKCTVPDIKTGQPLKKVLELTNDN